MKTIQNSLLSAFLPAADISAFDGVKNVLLADASVIRQNGKQQHQQRIRLCYSLNENRGPCPGGCRVWDSAEFYLRTGAGRGYDLKYTRCLSKNNGGG